MTPLVEGSGIWLPSAAYRREMRAERAERYKAASNPVTARGLLLRPRRLSLGISPHIYRYSLLNHFGGIYGRLQRLRLEGAGHLPVTGPRVFVMKHRAWADIAMHSMAYTWRTSGLHQGLDSADLARSGRVLREIIQAGDQCHFLMKEDLADLAVGVHLVMNGGIPVLQDLETKARNTPGFDPDAPAVKRRRERMSRWCPFTNAYREILRVLGEGRSIMIYGEATRVPGNRMGHIGTRFLDRLVKQVPGLVLVPVGTRISGRDYILSYGPACEPGALRERIAGLSGLGREAWIP